MTFQTGKIGNFKFHEFPGSVRTLYKQMNQKTGRITWL